MRWFEPTREQLALWERWCKSRPATVATIARRYPPWELYRLANSGHRCTIYSYIQTDEEGVELIVSVTGDFNLVTFNRNVFGIKPEDLTRCDLPGPDEVLGEIPITLVNTSNIPEAC